MNNNWIITFIERLTGYVSSIISFICILSAGSLYFLDTNIESGRQRTGLTIILLILGVLSFWFAYTLFKEVRKSRD